jgi:RimJ/RimL family protein N-acetyltransferase
MMRRWWRRRRGEVGEPAAEEAAPARGALVSEGDLIELRRHVPANREAFQRWYADPEIAALLRHDQEPLNAVQSKGYFDTFILPLSARGWCYAIHERGAGRLLGTTALTDVSRRAAGRSALFRIVIGEKDAWGRGFGTEATRLVVEEAFATHDLDEVRLEVFSHNPRAIAAYARVGFVRTGEHVEWISRRRQELRVVEMALTRDAYGEALAAADDEPFDDEDAADRGERRAIDGAARYGGPNSAVAEPAVDGDREPAP